jgi:hypothetical protein
MGIENVYIIGEASGNHAWNLVKLDDGNWYWIDLTWDDSATLKYNYFCVNDLQFVNWIDGEFGMPDGYVGNSTFLDSHTPNTPSHSLAFMRLYDIPARSDKPFSDADILELRETFTVDGCTYALVAYNTVQLVYVEAQGTVMIPEQVTYNDQTYTVVSIGAINENGYFAINGCVVSDGVTKIYIPATIITIRGKALSSETLERIIYID